MIYIKKLSLEQILWLDRKQKKINRKVKKAKHNCAKLRRLKIKRNKSLHNVNSDGNSLLSSPINFRKNDKEWNKLYAPDVFSIENNHNGTVLFFNKILEFISNQPVGSKLNIISKEVSKVSASALMYLIALIFDVKSIRYSIKGDYPSDIGARIFYEISGFNKFVMSDNKSKIEPLQNNIKIIMGKIVDPHVVRVVCDFVKENCCGLDTKELYAVLIELMNNALQHAYDETNRKLENKWLLFVEKSDCSIKFVFLDTGNGIPETVYKNYKEQVKILLGPLFKDIHSKLIKSAFMGELRTQTRLYNRGKGLPQIEDYFLSDYVDNASVFSGRGSYCIENDYLNKKQITLHDYQCNFNGTLFEWSINRRSLL